MASERQPTFRSLSELNFHIYPVPIDMCCNQDLESACNLGLLIEVAKSMQSRIVHRFALNID